LDRSPGNPIGEGALPTDHRQDNQREKDLKQDGYGQGDKRHQPVNILTKEASQHPKWEKVLYASMILCISLQFIRLKLLVRKLCSLSMQSG
jgi:cell division protein FtsL